MKTLISNEFVFIYQSINLCSFPLQIKLTDLYFFQKHLLMAALQNVLINMCRGEEYVKLLMSKLSIVDSKNRHGEASKKKELKRT